MRFYMEAPRIDLFEWLLKNAPHATYNLAFSNIYGVSVQEYKHLASSFFPDNFELGSNAQYGADELTQTLGSMYNCSRSNIVTTTGATEANFLLFSSLLEKGDEFIIEQPGYQPMWSTPEMLGARRINLPRTFEQRFRVQTELLENRITEKTRLLVLTNLHNPSGVYMDRATVTDIARIAADHGVYVLIDEIFLDGSFNPVSSSFGTPNVIVTGSATKIYGLGGLHTGWIIAPEEIAAHCQRRKAHTTGASSHTSEILTARILSAARDELIKRFQRRAKTNFGYLKKWMNQHAEFFEWVEPAGGIVCFPKYSMDITSLELCTYLLTTQKLLVNPGSYFNLEGFVRLSFGCSEELLQQALDALEKGLVSLKNRA
jgi:aspartate/methionine/tyrosine aminotransferase